MHCFLVSNKQRHSFNPFLFELVLDFYVFFTSQDLFSLFFNFIYHIIPHFTILSLWKLIALMPIEHLRIEITLFFRHLSCYFVIAHISLFFLIQPVLYLVKLLLRILIEPRERSLGLAKYETLRCLRQFEN